MILAMGLAAKILYIVLVFVFVAALTVWILDRGDDDPRGRGFQ